MIQDISNQEIVFKRLLTLLQVITGQVLHIQRQGGGDQQATADP